MFNANSADVLGQISLFDGLTPDELSALNHSLYCKTFPAGATIFTASQSSEIVYFVLNGTIKVCFESLNGTSGALSIYGVGDLLDEVSLIEFKHGLAERPRCSLEAICTACCEAACESML